MTLRWCGPTFSGTREGWPIFKQVQIQGTFGKTEADQVVTWKGVIPKDYCVWPSDCDAEKKKAEELTQKQSIVEADGIPLQQSIETGTADCGFKAAFQVEKFVDENGGCVCGHCLDA